MSGLNTMVKADARRMFTSSPFYILCGVALAVPVLILVMTSMVGGDGGTVFASTWQIIGSAAPSRDCPSRWARRAQRDW